MKLEQYREYGLLFIADKRMSSRLLMMATFGKGGLYYSHFVYFHIVCIFIASIDHFNFQSIN